MAKKKKAVAPAFASSRKKLIHLIKLWGEADEDVKTAFYEHVDAERKLAKLHKTLKNRAEK